ncbi:hypothetical protein [Pseudoalteromonas luteoviolacea]|uniref:hypothetical protein n=1 Tax=Pseudoalteromonas luteoviolacea TaxID=43657 RepID=UPI00114EE9A0|nr:hypothetical protein [Pseudoalteromonas luteoviolacea]TQF70457.1 hypothetical protein FLM44_05015 [Pseudoalteromonas luteoviolacea]
MRVVFFLICMLLSLGSLASSFESFIAEVNKEIKAREPEGSVYPDSIFIFSKKSNDKTIKRLSNNLPDDLPPTVIYTWTSTDKRLIKMIQGDSLGVVKKMMSESYQTDFYERCKVKDSAESIIASQGYDLMYVYKSPEGLILIEVLISKIKCNEIAGGV